MALKMYNEAKKDLNEILKLEPNNKQAKLDIEVVNKKIKSVGRKCLNFSISQLVIVYVNYYIIGRNTKKRY